MDEKVKESTKQIFELVGQAIFSAQLMEKELVFLVMVPEITKNQELPNSDRVYQEIEKLNKCTFGQLLKKLGNHATMNDATKKILAEALRKRNLLAHEFFHSHQGKLGDISENKIMRDELGKMRDLFKSIYDILRQESYGNLKKLGLISESTEKLL